MSKKINKRKVNLTVADSVLEQAKKVAEMRGESLSSIVERFLSMLSEDAVVGKDWLEEFHKKYLPTDRTEITDADINKFKSEQARKYL